MDYKYSATQSTGIPKVNNNQCIALVKHFRDANVALSLLYMYQDIPDDVQNFCIDKKGLADNYGISFNRQGKIYNTLLEDGLLIKEGELFRINKPRLYELMNDG